MIAHCSVYDNPQRRLESNLYNLFETEPLTEVSAKDINISMDSVQQLMRSTKWKILGIVFIYMSVKKT